MDVENKTSYQDLEGEVVSLEKQITSLKDKIQALEDYHHLLFVHHAEWCGHVNYQPFYPHTRRVIRKTEI